MNDNKIIGTKIQKIRESKQLTVEDVAERSGLSVEQIQRIEGNIDFPSLSPLIKIARVLGVRLGTFLDDQSELGPVVCRKGDLTGDGIGFTGAVPHRRGSLGRGRRVHLLLSRRRRIHLRVGRKIGNHLREKQLPAGRGRQHLL